MSAASAHNPKAEVLCSRAVTALLTTIRAKATQQHEFVAAADRLMQLLAEEALASLATPTTVETPCGNCDGLQLPDGHDICAVDIVRSGGILLEAVRRLCPNLKTAKILIQRNEETAQPTLYYKKLPEDIVGKRVILCDPMLATGGSATMAVGILRDAGVREEDILFVVTVAAPEGLKAMAERAPGVRILTACVDTGLNERCFIVPGLGDFGDRYYGSAGYRDGLWGTNGR